MPISDSDPRLDVAHAAGAAAVALRGCWNVQGLSDGAGGARARRRIAALRGALTDCAADASARWDLTRVEALDHVGALMLWQAWGGRRPAHLEMREQHRQLFDNLAAIVHAPAAAARRDLLAPVAAVGAEMLRFLEHLTGFVRLLGQLSLDLARFAARPQAGPWREISANVYRAGAQALGITALVGFLIGIVLSYLSAKQLKQFGADVFIVDLLGVAIIRELGPVLAAILVAGRSGSAMTASLGVMRVTEELDALTVMGIPHGFRLIMPKVLALAVALPLLILWTDAVSLLGGMVAAKIQLDLSIAFFFDALPAAVKIENLWIGLAKGAVFGALIALVSCHFGLRIEPNTESLGRGTTSAVVSSITVVILADAVFAIAFSNVGI
ncbi:MAG: ABC transporter permease [Burkholderiales bacterium]|nr:ABC transporter permease [Burkholderiales bacterium]